jgi:signal transduction histidine kinase/ActR/RegA family two-component response regulator
MLHLTLDTSPETVRTVADCLDDLEGASAHLAEDNPIRSLLAHGRVLDRVLPSTDAALKALRTTSEMRERETLRTILLKHQSASRASARASRIVLYVISLALVTLVVRLALELRSRAEALRRRASFEHVIATISMRFVEAPVQGTQAEIKRALAEMAHCVEADRAYFLASRPSAISQTWSQEGVVFPPGWPDRAAALASRFGRDSGGIVDISHLARLPSKEDRGLLAAQNLQGWTCASRVTEDDGHVILGFDAVGHPSRITREGELSLLGMALDAIMNAVRREHMDAERRRLQSRLQQARRMETVGALASGIAHNFNNIVGAILGHAEMAAEMCAPSDADRARNLDEIRRAADRARELVEQILAFGGRRENRRRPVSLRECVTETNSMLRASLPKGIDFAVGDIPSSAILAAESVQLQQVILNLCTNAAQAMDGVGRIELSAEIQELDCGRTLSHGRLAPGRYVSLAVRDSGRGMDEMTLARIFEPFFTTRADGNGLGLATVREIVSEYEGAMNVVSSPGAGSCFEAWLPCLAVSGSSPAAAAPAVHSLGNGETLLVIDDNRAQLLRSEEILAALGYEPVGCEAAESALQMCRDVPARFDAVVVGHIHLGDGLAIAAVIHELAPQLPVVLATAVIEAAAENLTVPHVCEIVHRPLITGEVAAALARSLTPHSGMTTMPRELSES